MRWSGGLGGLLVAACVVGCAPAPGATVSPSGSAAASMIAAPSAAVASGAPTLCLPTDGFCVPLPAGWRTVDVQRSTGPGGVGETVAALGPEAATLRLTGAGLIGWEGCGPTRGVDWSRDADLPGAAVVGTHDGAGVAARLTRTVVPACSPADELFAVGSGRAVAAKAWAPTRGALEPAADALAHAYWR